MAYLYYIKLKIFFQAAKALREYLSFLPQDHENVALGNYNSKGISAVKGDVCICFTGWLSSQCFYLFSPSSILKAVCEQAQYRCCPGTLWLQATRRTRQGKLTWGNLWLPGQSLARWLDTRHLLEESCQERVSWLESESIECASEVDPTMTAVSQTVNKQTNKQTILNTVCLLLSPPVIRPPVISPPVISLPVISPLVIRPPVISPPGYKAPWM